MKCQNKVIVAVVIPMSLTICISIVFAQIKNDNAAKRFPPIKFCEVAESIGKVNFVKEVAFPTVPQRLSVYKVQTTTAPKDIIIKILNALPVSSQTEKEDVMRDIKCRPEKSLQNGETISASMADWTVDVYKGGQFYISHRMPKSPERFEDIPSAPSAEEAQKVADEFVKKIPFLENIYCEKVCPGRIISRGLGPNDQVTKEMAVLYNAKIDDISLYGAVDVWIGAGPTVLRVNSRMRHLIQDDTVELISPEEAYDKLTKGKCHWSKDPSHSECKITSIRLVYYLGATADDLSYIMPTYLFSGESTETSKKPDTWKAYVEAVKPEYLNMESSQ
jgi:hypothetical protein